MDYAVESQVAAARGFSSVEEMRAFYERRDAPVGITDRREGRSGYETRSKSAWANGQWHSSKKAGASLPDVANPYDAISELSRRANSEVGWTDSDRELASRLNREMNEQRAKYNEIDSRRVGNASGTVFDRFSGDYERAFNDWIVTGNASPVLRAQGNRVEMRAPRETRASNDANALSTAPGAPAAGATGYDAGYMVPQGFWNHLAIALKKYAGGMLEDMHHITTETGNPMPWPTVDPTNISGSLITELNQLGFGGDSAGTDYQFGQGMLSAWTIVSGVILSSIQIEQDSAVDVSSFLSDRIGEAIGRKLGSLSVSGTGSSQPLGVQTALTARGVQASPGAGGLMALTAATNVQVLGGTSASPATVTERALGVPGAPNLVKMVTWVDPAYRELGSSWYVSDAQLLGLRQIVDFYDHPLLTDPAAGGYPTLWGYPVKLDANIPALPAGITIGGPIFGNLDRAFVRRSAPRGILRLHERYADYLQVGTLGYVREDFRSNDMRAVASAQFQAT